LHISCCAGRAEARFGPRRPWIFAEPKVIEGLDAVIKIASLGIDLPPAEIYGRRRIPKLGRRIVFALRFGHPLKTK